MKVLVKKILILCLVIIAVIGLFSVSSKESFADFNEQINYQGKLTDTNNLAVEDGAWRMYFRLYTTSTGGSNIWEEDRSSDAGDRITITSGLFSVMLGSSTPLSSVDFNQTLYLGVEICGLGSGAEDCDGEMTPRKVLGAVPAAFEAGKLSGLNSSQFLRSDAENATSTSSAFLRITQNGSGNIADFIGPSSASVLTLLSGGNIGVGTSTPYSRLSVWGSGTGSNRFFELTNSASTTIASFLEDGTGYFLGNIGIGTSTPGTIFSLGDTGDDTINISTTATSTFGTGINIRSGCFAINGVCIEGGGSGASTYLELTDTQSSFTANRIIHTNSAGNALTDTDGFVFDGTNFGIGTSSPYARLSVVGEAVAEYFTATSSAATSTFTNLYFTGNFRTPFSDNRVPFVSTNGILTQSADLTYVSGKLTAEGGLEISRNTDTYSHFGGSVANLPVTPTNTTDRLVSIKGVTGTSGERRGFLAAVDFTGSSSNSGANLAFQSIAKHSGSGALTTTTNAGGLSGGRVGTNFGSSALGAVSLVTGLSIINERPNLTVNSLSITELIGLQIEGGEFATTNFTNYAGIRIKSPSQTGGSMTNHYGLRIDNLAVGTNRWAIYADGTTKSYFGGNVGVGTTTPYAKLTAWSGGSGRIFEVINSASTTLFFAHEDGSVELGSTGAGNILFETNADSGEGGITLVGFGTSTPDADVSIVSNQPASNTYLFTIATSTAGSDVIDRKFTVDSDGDVAIDGSLTNPADYAEAFTVVGLKTEYEPGDIVSVSKTEPGKVEKTSSPYQGNMAGVYSTRPGIIGTLAKSPTAYKIEEENDIPVGVMGRVPVKVSTENGPIKNGDYITSSSQPGVGMKATKPGRAIGIALEDFDQSNVGKIMVFINSNTFYFGQEELDLSKRVSILEGAAFGDFGQGGILSFLENLGVKIQDGLAYFKSIITEKLIVGSREKPIGVTLFDTATGEPYCLSISGGTISSIPGECQAIIKNPGNSSPPPVGNSDSDGVNIEIDLEDLEDQIEPGVEIIEDSVSSEEPEPEPEPEPETAPEESNPESETQPDDTNNNQEP